jgi:hypothetical protein
MMSKEEWNEMVKGICNNEILPKLRENRMMFHHHKYFDDSFMDSEIYTASRTLRFIDDTFRDDYDLTRAYTKEYLDYTLGMLQRGMRNCNYLVLKTGISHVIEEFYEEIVDGMEISDIPEVDFDALREAGSRDPKSEILLSMVRIKHRKLKFDFNSHHFSIHYSLEKSEHLIEERREILRDSDSDNPPTKKKIFKGLGGICRGSILTCLDIGLMAGLCPVPLSSDALTVGAVTSLTTGLGDIMIAIGELRGE